MLTAPFENSCKTDQRGFRQRIRQTDSALDSNSQDTADPANSTGTVAVIILGCISGCHGTQVPAV